MLFIKPVVIHVARTKSRQLCAKRGGTLQFGGYRRGAIGIQFNDYWQSYSFGELGVTAQLRRELLARLIPKLKIRDCCSFAERYLIVRGELNTYHIHLGSGNILMEPGSRYLCIVPDRLKAASDKLILPFEGDSLLSVILSKAFLLADDRAITDPSIISQIKPTPRSN
jgi:hypothetical protein